MVSPRKLGASTACAALLLSACGGVATQDASGGEGGTECGDTIRIGAPYPLSGAWSQGGQNSLNGMLLAAEEINEAGGIEALDGAQIQIVKADTSSDNPAQAKAVTEELLQSGDMAAVVGSYLSSMTLTTVLATEQAGVPLITQSFVDDLTAKGYTTIFQIAPKSSRFAAATMEGLVDIFEQQGLELQRVATAGSEDAANKAQREAVAKISEEMGLEVVAEVGWPGGLTDATPIVNQIAGSDPDVVILAGPLSDLALVIKGLRGQGVTAPLVAPGGGGSLTPEFSDAIGPAVEGFLAAAAWNADLELEGVEEVNEAYKAEHGVFMPQEAGESWVAVHELAQIMEDNATCDPKEIRDALAEATFEEGKPAGMPPGKVAYDDTGANEFVDPVLVQWQSGELRTVYPPEVATTEALKISSGS
jgi:branched-chain amino acid transport system substrate-binding protein